MKLEIFDKSWLPPTDARGYRAISVNRRNARITLSSILSQEMGIQTDMSLYLARNTEAKCEWYIRFDNSDKGITIRPLNGGKSCRGAVALGVTSRGLSVMLLDSCKAQRGLTLLVAKNPTTIDGYYWFQLITAKPIRVN